MNKKTDHSCTKCGECCRKGGPLLHIEDMPLVRKGHISFDNLVTLRKGELAHDPIQESLKPLKAEVIKIKGTNEKAYPWHCTLHKDSGCGLHPLRPAQCASLSCKDTNKLKAMYSHNLATRQDIFTLEFANLNIDAKTLQGWLELVKIHEEECSLDKLANFAKHYQKHTDDILHMLNYDMAFRELCLQKAQVPRAALDLLLGRTLNYFLVGVGLEIRQDMGRPSIVAHKKSFYPI